MANEKKENRIQNNPINTEVAPDYLRTKEPAGIDDAGRYQTTPRIKIVEAMSDAAIKDEYGEGSLLVMPDGVLIAKYGESFGAVPLLFWPSWTKLADINDTQNAIRVEHTLDPQSELAKLCKNPASRKVEYENQPGFFYTHIESLNFVIEIQDGDAAGMVAALEYNRGRYVVGARLCGYLKRRNVHIYGNRLTMSAGRRTNRAGQTWYEVDFVSGNPAFVGESELARLNGVHDELKTVYNAGEIGMANDAMTAVSGVKELPV